VAYEKLLILESTWAAEDADYIRDSRSAARIYLSFGSLLSLHDEPVFAIHRPLLAGRYLSDIEQFVGLPSNKTGPNLIILSAHGSFQHRRKGHRLVNRRRLHAIDGEVKLSKDIHSLRGKLQRTIFVLDSCDIGARVASFQKAAGALGAIGFSKAIDWVDSAVFILAILLRFQEEGVFQMRGSRAKKPATVLANMAKGPYRSLAKELGLEFAFEKVVSKAQH
jgi:hypothetical protein